MSSRLRVGVIGCGLIAQVMHLHYLRELSDRFEIAALCDLSESVRGAVGREYGVARQFAAWQDLVAEPLDAVFVLTSGSHAPAAIAAAKAGRHVLVEKPMCFSVAEGNAMVEAATKARVTMMVAYNKRYDPAYSRFLEEARTLRDLRLLRITTLESPLEPYVKHYNLHRGSPPAPDLAESFARDDQARVTSAIGDADPLSRWAYRSVLLDSLVHEFNAMRGVMGEPDRLEFADIRETGLTAIFTYGATQCILSWVELLSKRGDHLLRRELQAGADPLPRMRDHRAHANYLRRGQHPRHRALRGGRARASKPIAARQAFRARADRCALIRWPARARPSSSPMHR